MPTFDTDRRARFHSAQTLAFIGAALFAGCIADEPGLTDPAGAGAAGRAGSQNGAGAGGSSANAGGQTGSEQAAVADNAAGFDAVGGSTPGGAPGNEQAAGAEPGSSAGSPGQGGESDQGGVHIPPVCAFHSEAAGPDEGAGGESTPTLTVQLSPFVGSYLADGAGRTLYTYGADLPGDCNTQPQSLCTADCLVSWPAFDAGARVLPEGLSDAGFGTIERDDGSFQTTYLGWPLYYHKSDLSLGQLTGQGKGKLWHAAEVILPLVTIMRTGVGAIKYLADGAGRTLYVSAADQAGTPDADPVSNCAGACLQTFEGFREKNLSIVTSLEPLDFSIFVRAGAGGLQIAYQGMPLYRAATDLKSGDMNGTAIAGFTAALP